MRSQARPPRQRRDRFPPSFQPQFRQQHLRPLLQVQRVDVQPLDPRLLIRQYRPAHIPHQLRPHLPHLLIIALDRVELLVKVVRDDDLLAVDPFLEFFPVLDRHDSRDDGDGDTGGTNATDPVKEDLGVVEELGEDEVGASFDLGLQPFDLLFPSFWRIGGFGMTLRETGDSDAKVSRVGLVDVFDEVDGVVKAARCRLPGGSTRNGVTAEGENILAAVCFCFLDDQLCIAHKHDKRLTTRASLTFSAGTSGQL